MPSSAAPGGSEQHFRKPVRRDGYAPIEDYGALGDGRTVALVGLDGRIDWWPVPAIDSPPAFAALLDPERGGFLALQPRIPFETSRRYLPGTNVLETTFRTSSGTVRITDSLSVGAAGTLPWGELIRHVEGLAGEVPMQWCVSPGSRFGSAQPWTAPVDAGVVLHLGDQHLGVLCSNTGPPDVSAHDTSGRFTTSAGSDGFVAVTVSDAEPLFLPRREDLLDHARRTIRRWQEWSDGVHYEGRWAAAVERSALALKLLLYSPTGAIAAAPTTSLPERIGGDKNWDYRYMWVRDSSFTVDALLNLQLHEEVQGSVSYLLDVVRRTAPNLHVFYTLDGRVPQSQDELAAPGYRGSQPVRSGNGAADQTQLGTFGDFFDTMWRYVRHGHVLDPPTGRLLAELADRCCDVWQNPDAGIWELGVERHYTISKMGCWVALDRAARLAEVGAIATEHAGRWEAERDQIKAWVNEFCWSATKSSYTFYAGTDELDAATLLAGQTGFDQGARLAGTVDAIRRELSDGPLVYRYSGMAEQEGAFIACTYWLVSALTHLDRLDDARQLLDESMCLANDLGLLSEQHGARPGQLLGNFPQGLSHLALINAATTLSERLRDHDRNQERV